MLIQTIEIMRKLLFFAVLACGITVLGHTGEARAQDNAAGVHIGYNTSMEELFAGVHGRFDITGLLGPNLVVVSNPALDLYFIENMTFLQADVNLLFPFMRVAQPGTVVPYAGTGLAVIHTSISGVDVSSTDLGLNLLGGVWFNTGQTIQPYLQARYTLLSGEYFTLGGGVSVRF